MGSFFNIFFYKPLYNAFVFLMDLLPWFDAGIIVVLFTIIVKFLLYPLARKVFFTQTRMKSAEAELKAVREKYTDRQEQARQTLLIYKKYEINPLSGFFIILIQLPIIFALYYVFLRSGLPQINTSLLYGMVPVPQSIDIEFLNLIDISKKSLFLALGAGLSTFIQTRLSLPPVKPRGETVQFQEELARSMTTQMKYVLPVIIFIFSYTLPAAVALYWTTSNIFTIFQDRYLKFKYKVPTKA